MRVVIDLSAHDPVRLETLEDGIDTAGIKEKLSEEWTLYDVMQAEDVSKSTAWRMVQCWAQAGCRRKKSLC